MGSRASLDVLKMGEKKFLPVPEIEPRLFGCSARSVVTVQSNGNDTAFATNKEKVATLTVKTRISHAEVQRTACTNGLHLI